MVSLIGARRNEKRSSEINPNLRMREWCGGLYCNLSCWELLVLGSCLTSVPFSSSKSSHEIADQTLERFGL